MKIGEFFLLTWKKVWIIVVSGFLGILLHNFWYAIFGFEDAVFFIYVVFVLPIYFLISVIYSLVKRLVKNEK